MNQFNPPTPTPCTGLQSQCAPSWGWHYWHQAHPQQLQVADFCSGCHAPCSKVFKIIPRYLWGLLKPKAVEVFHSGTLKSADMQGTAKLSAAGSQLLSVFPAGVRLLAPHHPRAWHNQIWFFFLCFQMETGNRPSVYIWTNKIRYLGDTVRVQSMAKAQPTPGNSPRRPLDRAGKTGAMPLGR